MKNWERLAIRAAQREAACRRFHRRIHGMPITNYGAYQRRQKRMSHIDRDYCRLRHRSIDEAVKMGVGAEGWQDVYYREIERLGERATTGVAKRFRDADDAVATLGAPHEG